MHRTSIVILGTVAFTAGCSEGKENNPNFESTAKLKTLAENRNPKNVANQAVASSYLNTKGVVKVTDIIPSTDIHKRLKQIEQSRSDPFAPIFTSPKIVTQVHKKKNNPSIKVPSTTAPKQEPPPPSVEPSLNLAKNTSVQGVIQTEKNLYAIVKLPEDKTSRYVGEGEELPGGEVSVKRIEIKPDSEPLVILEQNGTEVAKTVGSEESTISLNTSDLQANSKPQPESSLGTNRSQRNLEVIPVPTPPPIPINGSLSAKNSQHKLKTLPPPTAIQASSPLFTANQSPQALKLSKDKQQLISQLRKAKLPVNPPSALLQPSSQAKLQEQELISKLRQPSSVQNYERSLQIQNEITAGSINRQDLILKLRQSSLVETPRY